MKRQLLWRKMVYIAVKSLTIPLELERMYYTFLKQRNQQCRCQLLMQHRHFNYGDMGGAEISKYLC